MASNQREPLLLASGRRHQADPISLMHSVHAELGLAWAERTIEACAAEPHKL